MQYFVSAANNFYFYWQLELLIQSFKELNLENDLVIALAETNTAHSLWKEPKNLIAHKRKFSHSSHDYKPLNKIHSILFALENGLLEQPFVLLHPDMVLKKPITVNKEDNLVFDNSLIFDDELKSKLESLIKLNWFSAAGSMVFQNVPIDFFKQIISKLSGNDKDWEEERAAWILTINEFVGHFQIRGDSFECQLLDNDNKNIIHYRYGLPPTFHKKFFKKSNLMFTGSSPYQAILDSDSTLNTHYLVDLINKYFKTY